NYFFKKPFGLIMLLRIYILLYAFVFAPIIFKSQNCNLTLRGVVQDEDNRESLGFAVVKLLSPEKIIQTNEKGEFSFENLCKGDYQILVQHIGCKDTIFHVSLLKSKNVLLKLPHSLHNLEEVDIMDKRVEMKTT